MVWSGLVWYDGGETGGSVDWGRRRGTDDKVRTLANECGSLCWSFMDDGVGYAL